MKFAVIEYTTKTGRIWHAMPGHPNYLGDPQTEIDPTSFGCYTTALQGEHIPLIGLITGDIYNLNPFQVASRKIIKRVAGSWPQSYSLKYLAKFDVLLVVHQISNAHEITAFTARLKQTYPQIFALGVPTQPYGLLREQLDRNQDAKQHFIDYINSCDLFLTVVASTKSWYQSLTTTPVEYLPQIYPAHYAKRFWLPRHQKEKVIFVAGITDRPNIRQGHLLAKRLQQKFPEYLIAVTEIPGVALNLQYLKGTRYTVLPFEQWREHLPSLAKMMLVINTDYTQTRGRVQTDCAAVGTPSLGGNSDGEADLFSELKSDLSTPLDQLVLLGERLLTNTAFYEQIVSRAQSRLQKYDYEESAARLQLIVKSHQS